MPPVNSYFRDPAHRAELVAGIKPLKEHVAKELSAERALSPNEVSVRIIEAIGDGMLADVELDIVAEVSPSKVAREDAICASVREYVLDQHPLLMTQKCG